MNPIKSMNDALNYIEEHLTTEVDLQTAARIACCSEHHFKRTFSFLVGIPLSEYIRRRRLTLAAQELSSSDAKVIDLAVKYGYESPDAFARAFSALHGVSPSEARRAGQTLKAFSRVTFQMTIRGGSTLNYRIVEKGPFRFVGIKKRVKLVYSGANPEIDAMWSMLDEDKLRLLKELSDMEPTGILCASANFSEGREEGGSLDQYIGTATTKPCPEQSVSLEVAASTWAVFESVGPFPETLQNTWARIYAEWFPSSDYEEAEGPTILWNEGKDTSSPTYRSELWVPVKKRRKSC